MTNHAQRATIEEAGTTGGKIERHPAYGMISASRISAGPPGVTLYGSDFKHQHFVQIRAYPSHMERGINNDWFFTERMPYIEVSLSESQWATFVSSMNHGSGVPCTVEIANGERKPDIIPGADRRAQLREEVEDRLKDGMDALRELQTLIEGTGISIKQKKVLLDHLWTTQQQLGANLKFTADQFDEHAERTIEKMKHEISAYVDNAVRRAGLQALGAPAEPILQLQEGDE